MSKKHYYIVVDTETTQDDRVVDFGAVVCDRKGNIVAECGVMVRATFGKVDLFHDNSAGELWNKKSLARRMGRYLKMVDSGQRMVASVAAINKWLAQAVARYNPELTAYNMAFDLEKCQNTGIDLGMFEKRFCLWQAAAGMFAQTKKYRQFVLDNHFFNAPTKWRNMTYKTNAEVMAGYLTGNFQDEPHTALEDAKFFELPILVEVVKRRQWREKIKPYNWKSYQARDWFRP